MDVNTFILQLKSDHPEHDVTKLDEYYRIYVKLFENTRETIRAKFALNVLSMLARNIEASQEWANTVDPNLLLLISMRCVEDCVGSNPSNCIKVLGCTYRLHKYATSKKAKTDLILKFSQLIFAADNLISEHINTYWAILIDRVIFARNLKSDNYDITLLIPDILKDLKKIIDKNDLVKFILENLVISMRHLSQTFSEKYPKKLDKLFIDIFQYLFNHRDIKKKVEADVVFEIYSKINDCICVMIENMIRFEYDDVSFIHAIEFANKFIGSNAEVGHCLQDFYRDFIYVLFRESNNCDIITKALSPVAVAVDLTEKLGYNKAGKITWRYINQNLQNFLLFIRDKRYLATVMTQTNTEIISEILMMLPKILDNVQITKCGYCTVNSKSHDIYRSMLALQKVYKTLIECNMSVNSDDVISLHNALKAEILHLKQISCPNHEKVLLCMQTECHNIAILLYRNKLYELSLKLFDFYIQTELQYSANSQGSLCRVLYNKAICSFDTGLYEKSLESAYLGYALSKIYMSDGDKCMGMVISVKSKIAITTGDTESVMSEKDNSILTRTAFDVYRMVAKYPKYEGLKRYLGNACFEEILIGEIEEYFKIWPSTVPITSTLKTLFNIYKLSSDQKSAKTTLESLCSLTARSASKMRSIENKTYEVLIDDLITELRQQTVVATNFRICLATLLILKGECNIANAKEKYGWRVPQKNTCDEAETMVISQTFIHEYEALKPLKDAVIHLAQLVRDLLKDPKVLLNHLELLKTTLEISSVSVNTLVYFSLEHFAVQMAFANIKICQVLKMPEVFLLNLSTMLRFARKEYPELDKLVISSARMLEICLKAECSMDIGLECLCDMAMYEHRKGNKQLALKLIRYVQKIVLQSPKARKFTSVCYLLLNEALFCEEITQQSCDLVAALNCAQRRLLAANKFGDETSWSKRRLSVLRWSVCAADIWHANAVATCQSATTRRASHTRPTCNAAQRAKALALSCWNDLKLGREIKNKIDAMKTILAEHTEKKLRQSPEKSKPIGEKTQLRHNNGIETILDANFAKQVEITPGSPRFVINSFETPAFIEHCNDCKCYACNTFQYSMLFLEISTLEASMYFKKYELDLADSYLKGTASLFDSIYDKLKTRLEQLKCKFDDFIVEMTEDSIFNELKLIELYLMMEYTFYEMSKGSLDKCYKLAQFTKIIFDELIDKPLQLEGDILNMFCSLYKVKENKSNIDTLGIENDLERLKLSPQSAFISKGSPKTPEIKSKDPPKITKPKIIYNAEEMPQIKKRLIKLNLDAQNSPCVEKVFKTISTPIPDIKILQPEEFVEAIEKTSHKTTNKIFKTRRMANSEESVGNVKATSSKLKTVIDPALQKTETATTKRTTTTRRAGKNNPTISNQKVATVESEVLITESDVLTVKKEKTTETKVYTARNKITSSNVNAPVSKNSRTATGKKLATSKSDTATVSETSTTNKTVAISKSDTATVHGTATRNKKVPSSKDDNAVVSEATAATNRNGAVKTRNGTAEGERLQSKSKIPTSKREVTSVRSRYRL